MTTESTENQPNHRKVITNITQKREDVDELLLKMNVLKSRGSLPKSVNLQKWCSPVRDQGELNSGAAFAGSGMIEYYENITAGKYVEASSLFLYKVARNLLQLTGDMLVLPRTIMGALVLIGVPPEKYWPYTDTLGSIPHGFDKEPPAFCYSLAQNYQATQYLKIDQPELSENEFLDMIKINISEKFPLMFKFDVFESIDQSISNGKIPYPENDEEIVLPDHGIMVVGYDDSIKIENTNSNKETEGALLVKNSWSINWGNKGYGWLPYDYVLKDIAKDCWSLLQSEWVDIDAFEL